MSAECADDDGAVEAEGLTRANLSNRIYYMDQFERKNLISFLSCM